MICLKPKFEGLRVLLAEDNMINIKLMQKFFEWLGIILDTAENGKICINKKNQQIWYNIDGFIYAWDGWKWNYSLHKRHNESRYPNHWT